MQSGKVNTIAKKPKPHPIISKIRPIALFVILPIAFIIIYAYSPAFELVRFFPSESNFYILGIFFGINILLFMCYFNKVRSRGRNLKLAKRFYLNKTLDDHFLEDWHPEDATTELSYIEKVAYIAVPIMIFFTVIYEINYFYPDISGQPNLIGKFISAYRRRV